MVGDERNQLGVVEWVGDLGTGRHVPAHAPRLREHAIDECLRRRGAQGAVAIARRDASRSQHSDQQTRLVDRVARLAPQGAARAAQRAAVGVVAQVLHVLEGGGGVLVELSRLPEHIVIAGVGVHRRSQVCRVSAGRRDRGWSCAGGHRLTPALGRDLCPAVEFDEAALCRWCLDREGDRLAGQGRNVGQNPDQRRAVLDRVARRAQQRRAGGQGVRHRDAAQRVGILSDGIAGRNLEGIGHGSCIWNLREVHGEEVVGHAERDDSRTRHVARLQPRDGYGRCNRVWLGGAGG